MSNLKTIAFVGGTAGMGGVEYSTLYLAESLDNKEWKPLVICPEEGDLTKACRKRNISVEIIPRPTLYSTSLRVGDKRIPNIFSLPVNLWGILWGVHNLSRFLNKRQVDLVVTKGLLTHIYGGMAARNANIPCIWHHQDFISERYFGLYSKTFGLVSRWLPSHIIVDGGPIAGQLPGSIQEKISLIFNGVDTSIFKPSGNGAEVRDEFGIPRDATVIGNVARVTPWKGQHHLVNAFTLAWQQLPNTYLLLVGSPLFDTDTYERRIKDQVRNAGLEKQVIFAGYRYDLPRVLSSMDIFAYAAIEKDTSPLALLSAMATGLPIVAFGIDGIAELMSNGHEGILVPPKDENQLANALVTLAQNPALRINLAKNVREKALKLFDLNIFVQTSESLFRKILD